MMRLSDLQGSLELCRLDAEKEKLLIERDDARGSLQKWKNIVADTHEVMKQALDIYGSDPNPEAHVIFIHIMHRITNILKTAKDNM